MAIFSSRACCNHWVKAYINVQGSKAEEQGLLNKPWKDGKAKVNAGVKVLLCREAWWSTNTRRTRPWQQQVSIPRITAHWTPLWQRPCLPWAGCTCGDLQKWRAALHCTGGWQQSSEHNVVFWFPAQLHSHHSDFNQLQRTMVNKIQKQVPPLLQFLPKMTFCYKFKQLYKCGKKPLE